MGVDYESWREAVFGQAPDCDPVTADLPSDAYTLDELTVLDYIDRALVDAEIHRRFDKAQIGIGLNILFSNSCSDYPFAYVGKVKVPRRVVAIDNLSALYDKYFERYCTEPMNEVGAGGDGQMGFICYMFWDIFVLWPGSPGATDEIIAAGVGVMERALRSTNDNVLASAFHGLGHWRDELPAVAAIIRRWRAAPTTGNPAVIAYARSSEAGCIQ